MNSILNGKRNANEEKSGANVETTEERAQDPFHRFVNKARRASPDWRSELQACFRKTAEDFLDAKFQNTS